MGWCCRNTCNFFTIDAFVISLYILLLCVVFHLFNRCTCFSSVFFFFFFSLFFEAEDEQKAESATCGKALIILSWALVCITMPFSLFVCFKVSSIAFTFIHNSFYTISDFLPADLYVKTCWKSLENEQSVIKCPHSVVILDILSN